MAQVLNKIRATHAKRQLLRFFASVVLAIIILYLVRYGLTPLAVLVALASKWQVLLGGPRLWLHNIWDNSVDIIFILSIIVLLAIYNVDPGMQIGVMGLYLGWQVFIKPLSGVSGHGVQSLLMLALAITVIFIMKASVGVAGMMVLSGVAALAAADHYLVSITDDASLRRLLMAVWALVTVEAVWIFGHWLVFYPFMDGQILVPQIVLVLVALGYVFGIIYYDHHLKQLSRKRLYSYLGLAAVISIILIMGSEWVAQL